MKNEKKNRKNITHIKCQLCFFPFLFLSVSMVSFISSFFTFRRQQGIPSSILVKCLCPHYYLWRQSHFILSPLSDSDFLNGLNYSVQLTWPSDLFPTFPFIYISSCKPTWILANTFPVIHIVVTISPMISHFQKCWGSVQGLNFSLKLCICVFSPKLYPTSWSLLTFIPRTP